MKPFTCKECGYGDFTRKGICPNCGAVNPFEKTQKTEVRAGKTFKKTTVTAPKTFTLSNYQAETAKMLKTGIGEFDRVLSAEGGLAPAQTVTFYAPPGTGKSTLLGMVASRSMVSTLYASAEETVSAIMKRHKRIGADSPHLEVVSTNVWEEVEAIIDAGDYKLVIVDSINAFTSNTVDSRAGNRSQIEAVVDGIIGTAQRKMIPILIVSQVTKTGEVSGPNTALHAVDTVLSLSRAENSQLLFLRPEKNRHGDVSEVGIFTHRKNGFDEVPNPEEYLTSNHTEPVSGCAKVIMNEGKRYMLAEVQALVTQTGSPNPKRVVDQGIKKPRLETILGVLERHGVGRFYDKDVYLTTVGGAKLEERGADLAIAYALISSLRGNTTEKIPVVDGEVFLTGEVAPSQDLEQKRAYAKRLGVDMIIMNNVRQLNMDK